MLKALHDDFGVEVTGVKTLADFMGRIKGLKRIPASWQDVFLPVIADTASN
jgi:NitT/TauT family transport system substrate-binding protein